MADKGKVWERKCRGEVRSNHRVPEFQTSRVDEIEALANEMEDRRQAGTVQSVTVTADRDHLNRYRTIAVFDSYESAMQNSQRP